MILDICSGNTPPCTRKPGLLGEVWALPGPDLLGSLQAGKEAPLGVTVLDGTWRMELRTHAPQGTASPAPRDPALSGQHEAVIFPNQAGSVSIISLPYLP